MATMLTDRQLDPWEQRWRDLNQNVIFSIHGNVIGNSICEILAIFWHQNVDWYNSESQLHLLTFLTLWNCAYIRVQI